MPAHRGSYRASRDLDKEAEIVQDIEASRADRVPWLVHTGFPTHLQGLRDTEIMSSYALPRSVDGDDDDGGDGDDDDGEGEEEGGVGDTDIDLRRILAAGESTLRDAPSSNYRDFTNHYVGIH
ncbi:telomere-associated recq helicase [Fusarium austroafricanum]|uniref:Telomere-associated recq helicase n=1 Tax=Fusarium austroafricanum TaxID=2364996 RepID=A0A8H4JQA4_9HYPO|nr:telomere-associated recq helicase [Fusarium austroafricanum]